MLYIVCGIPRSGTSMMMRALMDGGLEGAYKPDPVIAEVNGYHPNKDGFYGCDEKEIYTEGFPKQLDGKLIKLLYVQLKTVGEMPGGIRIVYMRRDPKEGMASFQKFCGGKALFSMEHENERFDAMIKKFSARADVLSADEFQYDKVLKSPLKHFELLKEHGWEIDSEICARVPKEEYRHFKSEVK